MSTLAKTLATSVLLAEKVASARPASQALREKLAMADFAAFGLFKQAAIDPAAISALQRGLGWGVGLGVPALAAGHMFLGDAQRHSADVLRDARNQALLTAAGVGGMEALGNAFKRAPHPIASSAPTTLPPAPEEMTPDKIAAAILVDDVLEAACHELTDPDAKHAALVRLIIHRGEASRLLRGLLP
jgi:hypothetical protein